MSKAFHILVICGPTASGKTSLALKIAGLFPRANILSVDSRQIYQGLDIVTGKDIPHNLSSSIKIFGLDLIKPDQKFNLADFVKYSRQIIKQSVKNSIPLIIVGGTGLFLKAVTSDYLDVNTPPDIDLRRMLEGLTVNALQKKLSGINPEKLASMNNSDVNNPRRLIRAIEISLGQKPPKKDFLPSGIKFHWIGLSQNKETHKENIKIRVEDRLSHGAVDEIKKLVLEYPDSSLPVYTSLGVKEIVDYLENKLSYSEMCDLWVTKEIDYARRQMVWFKKQPDIVWYDRDSIGLELIHNLTGLIK